VADSSCGAAGSGGREAAQNTAKNNFCAAPSQQGQPNPATFASFQRLMVTVTNDHSINFGDRNTATRQAGPTTNRTKLKQLGEGRLAQIEGVVLIARQEGKESVNCGPSVPDDPLQHDIHISLVPPNDNDECHSIVVEMNPHHRPPEWTAANVDALAKGHRVRVTGQMMFDSSHLPCVNDQKVGNNPKRFSLWEIHPIYRFEVCTANCDGNNPTWMKLEDLVQQSASHSGQQ